MFTKKAINRIFPILKVNKLKVIQFSSMSFKKLSKYNMLCQNNISPLINKKSIYCFSEQKPQKQSSRYPQIAAIKKKLQEMKKKDGVQNQQYVSLLNNLTVQLVLQQIYIEATETAEKVIELFKNLYQKSKKQLTDDCQFLMYQKSLQGIYGTRNLIQKNVKLTEQIVQIEKKISKQNPNLVKALVEDYLNLGRYYYQLKNIQKALQMFENTIKSAASDSNNPLSRQKIVFAKNCIAYICHYDKNQLVKAQQLLQECIAEIQNIYHQDFQQQLLSTTVMDLCQIYVKTLSQLSKQKVSSFLSRIKQFSQTICLYYLNNNLPIKQLISFYNNLGRLNLYSKNYEQSLQCYKFVRQQLTDQEYELIAQSHYNQGLVLQQMKKYDKAIDKLKRSHDFREKLNTQIYQKKHRINDQDTLKLKQNKSIQKDTCVKLVQLYSLNKDSNNANLWENKLKQYLKQ